MTDDDLHDELVTLLLAGHETTATSISWALYWIHRDRQVHQTLTEELKTLGSAFDPMDVAQLPYLNAVCNEALRIGGGVRRCIGEVLAQFEMKLVVATVLQNHRFSLAETQPEIPTRRGVTLGPGRGVRMILDSV